MDTVLTLTMNPTVDIGAEVERLEPSRKLRSATARYEPGGGGVNVARGIRMLGGEVCAMFPGGGSVGDLLEQLLGAEEVPCQRIPIRGITRQSFAVRVTGPGELFHFVLPGPELDAGEIDAVLEAVARRDPSPAWLVVSGSLPPGVGDDFFARLARTACEQDVRLVLDTHGEPLRLALREPVYLIKPNRHEFAELIGAEPEDQPALRRCARELVADRRLHALIVTLGDQGALLTTRDEQVQVCPPRVEVVSPVGAGDSFLALCTHHLARGAPLRDAFAWGVAGAAAAVCTPGTELFRVDDVERLHAKLHEQADAPA